MEAKLSLHYDVLDFGGPSREEDLTGPPARHALVFSLAWRRLLGSAPPSSAHDRYCGGVLPQSGLLDKPRFLRFVSAELRLPVQPEQRQELDVRQYALSLEDPEVLRRETVAKLCDRYDGGPPELFAGRSLAAAHAALRAAAATGGPEQSRNPATGSFLGPDPCPPPTPPCLREAWRGVASRDILFAARANQGRCVFVDSEAGAHLASASVVASEAAASCRAPITLMSDCSRILRELSEQADFYHYAVHVPCPDAYASLPPLFQSFVHVGGNGSRPPLCRARGRCWLYLLGDRALSRAGAAAYSVVAASFEGCLAAQAAAGRLAYLAPPVLGPGAPKTVRIGFHPDTLCAVSSVKDPRAVPPELSDTCEIYVSCVSEEGVERCMASGGVAVARAFRLIDDGVSGFLSGDGSAESIDAAVLRAVSASRGVAEEALRVRVLFAEETSRWLWRGFLGRSDPVVSRQPADAALLHERFLVLSATLRFREAVRYRATTAGRRAVVFVDNRPDPGTALAVMLSLANLGAGWGVVGFVTEESRRYYSQVLAHLGGDLVLVDMPGYRSKSYFIEQYNARMKSVETWLEVARHADVCLTVQSDGLLARPGLERHPCVRHDYCGAPWRAHPYLHAATGGNLVGNGGFSFRSVQEMLHVCRLHSAEAEGVYPMAPVMSQAEDVFFASRVRRPCPAESAASFAMEQVPSPDALGYHRFWVYHPVEFTVDYFERLLRQTAACVPSTREPPGAPPLRPLRRRAGGDAAKIL